MRLGRVWGNITESTVDQCWQLLKRTDALRKPKRFLQFVKVSWMLDSDEDDFSNYQPHTILVQALKLCQGVTIKQIADFKTLSGKKLVYSCKRNVSRR